MGRYIGVFGAVIRPVVLTTDAGAPATSVLRIERGGGEVAVFLLRPGDLRLGPFLRGQGLQSEDVFAHPLLGCS